jgi:hypothetical protein
MDTIQRYEFHAIFDRVSTNIDLKGCTSALAIEIALAEARDKSKVKFKTYRMKAKKVRFGRKAEWLDTLVEHDFAGRAIFEAHRNQRGLIALTLIHGRQKAQRILAQRRAEYRSRLAYPMGPRAPRKIPKRPELRRIPTRRRRLRGEQF